MKLIQRPIIITGPSGVGKGTVVKEILKKNEKFCVSISATTRNPRIGEIDSKDYYFLTKGKFKEMIDKDLFIEWAKFTDNYYGTPVSSIKEKIEKGFKVILEIEVKGATQVKEKYPNALLIFLMPPSKEELERRIRSRGTDDEKSISKRLKRADFEISSSSKFDYVIINNSIEQTVEKILDLVLKEKIWLINSLDGKVDQGKIY